MPFMGLFNRTLSRLSTIISIITGRWDISLPLLVSTVLSLLALYPPWMDYLFKSHPDQSKPEMNSEYTTRSPGTENLTSRDVKNSSEFNAKPSGISIIFSTGSGQLAIDSVNSNYSPMVSSILKRLPNDQVDFRSLLASIRSDVKIVTKGSQTPWLHDGSVGDFRFSDENNHLRKRAIIIGNSHYNDENLSITTPSYDLVSLSDMFIKLGFSVTPYLDLKYDDFKKVMDNIIFDESDIIVFIYSGHSFEFGNDFHAIPTDYSIEQYNIYKQRAGDEQKSGLVSLSKTISQIELKYSSYQIYSLSPNQTGTRGLSLGTTDSLALKEHQVKKYSPMPLFIFFLDGCRNNPFSK